MELSGSTSDDERTAAKKPLFEVSSRVDGDRAEITLSGELDLGDADRVTRTLRDVLEGQVDSIEINVQALRFIDSAGLQSLLDAREAARSAGVIFKIVGASAPVRRVVGLAGLDDLLY